MPVWMIGQINRQQNLVMPKRHPPDAHTARINVLVSLDREGSRLTCPPYRRGKSGRSLADLSNRVRYPCSFRTHCIE